MSNILELVQKILFWAGASLKGQIIFAVIKKWFEGLGL